MSRSQSKPWRKDARRALGRLPLAMAVCVACQSMAYAQEAPPPADPQQAQPQQAQPQQEAPTLDTITVTAQKREENLQKVPISIQAIGTEELERHDVAAFNDYAKLIPSVSFGTAGGGVFSGPGFLQVYMRGVASGGDGNHSGSQPSVGVYLDEQPITANTGSLDVHMYDIARVEALAGPQGTLYGASSQAGTLRIITNKPDPTGFAASASGQVSVIDGGGIGNVFEGMVNLPVNDRTAVRLVGWQKHDAGYVDNRPASRVFPSSGIVENNDALVDKDYNYADTVGVRAALRAEFGDDWSITPAIMAQRQEGHGSTGYDPTVGDLAVAHSYPESSEDRWWQAALTVQGKVGNFDLTYTFARLRRDVDSEADYSDYGFWYDTLASYGLYACDDFDLDAFTCAGNLVNPSQYIQAKDGYRKTSHELRIASPAGHRLRVVGGVFWQEQEHDILQRYRIDGIDAETEIPGWEDTIWLTAQQRKDRDEAVFGEVSFDITDRLTLTGGARYFRARNSLKGFFGFGDWGWSSTGVASCFSPEQLMGAPCTNLDKSVRETGSLGRVNLTWEIDDNKLVYATWSEGFRPGGINRRGTLPPYRSDFLTNYELGWKTSWANNRLVFNGAVFREDWDDFQFSYLGQNGLTEIRNAAQARVDGLELELRWAATYNLDISAGLAWYDARLMKDYCAQTDANNVPVADCYLAERPYDVAFEGDRLPVTPKVKANVTTRYTWDVGPYEAHVQAAVFHQGDRVTDLREAQRNLLGDLDAYTMADLSAGWRRGSWQLDLFLKNVTDKRAQLTRFAECATLVCGNQPYTVVAQPRTFGVRISKDF